MKKEELRIVYMGTPEFAVESLRALAEGGYNVCPPNHYFTTLHPLGNS